MIVKVIEGKLAKDRKCFLKCEKCDKIRGPVKWWGPCYKDEHPCRSCVVREMSTGRECTIEQRIKLSKSNIKAKGGKASRIQSGYKQILLPIDSTHPRIKPRKGGRYIMEHILIMEEKIGKYLDEGAIIHHIDCDKLNNKIENLFLIEGDNVITRHNAIHHQLESVAAVLVKEGIIRFAEGEYYLSKELESLISAQKCRN